MNEVQNSPEQKTGSEHHEFQLQDFQRATIYDPRPYDMSVCRTRTSLPETTFVKTVSRDSASNLAIIRTFSLDTLTLSHTVESWLGQ